MPPLSERRNLIKFPGCSDKGQSVNLFKSALSQQLMQISELPHLKSKEGALMELKREIIERIAMKCPDGEITCRKAFQLADELGITLRQMGEALNQLKIKITGCQLGCF